MKLTIGNSSSRVEGLDTSQFQSLRKLLSYKINAAGAYFSGAPSRERYLLSARGEFPTGLVYLVYQWVIDTKTPLAIEDTRKCPKWLPGLFALKLNHTPYPWQEDAATACFAHHRGVVVAPCGTGKSTVTALIASRLQVPTLIVVPTLELRRQLTESLTEAFGGERVGRLGSALAVENVDALDPKKPLRGYDCVIIDEFHRSAAKTYRQLNAKCWKDVYYRFGTTATAFRSNEDERLLLEGVLSQVIYRLDYKTAISNGYIVPLEAFYVEVPKTVTQSETWAGVYSDLVVDNEGRNHIIRKLAELLHGSNRSALTLVKEVEHAYKLSDTVAHAANEEAVKLIREFSQGERLSLTATAGLMGEGIDCRAAEYLIYAGLGKSKNALMQSFGRVLRKYPGKESGKVILFKDPSHRWTRDHFCKQRKILLDEYGVSVVELKI